MIWKIFPVTGEVCQLNNQRQRKEVKEMELKKKLKPNAAIVPKPAVPLAGSKSESVPINTHVKI